MNVVDRISDHVVGAQILSLEMDEVTEVFTLVLSNGIRLYLVGGLGLSAADTEKWH
jgi:hypothetical protein